MTTFNSTQSVDYRAAVRALLKLSVCERQQAAAEAISPSLILTEAKECGKKTNSSWEKLIHKRPTSHRSIPGQDHGYLRSKNNFNRYISHPYHLDNKDIQEMAKHCNEHGLRVRIGGVSSYYPGVTLCVTYVNAEEYRKKLCLPWE